MIRAIIVDDEPLARDYLRLLLHRIGGVEVVGEAEDANSCLEVVTASRPDVAFLDIRLPGMNGTELAEIISKGDHPAHVIFTTGYEDYAAGAFNIGATDYILKPFDEDRLRKAVNRLVSNTGKYMTNQPLTATALCNAKLPIKQRDGWKLVEIRDILYIKTEGRKTRIQTTSERYLTHFTIAELEQRLAGAEFFRANEGCLVNLKYVQEIVSYGPRTYEVFLSDEKETCIPLSRSRAQKLKELLGLR